jgi:hypothetical protein
MASFLNLLHEWTKWRPVAADNTPMRRVCKQRFRFLPNNLLRLVKTGKGIGQEAITRLSPGKSDYRKLARCRELMAVRLVIKGGSRVLHPTVFRVQILLLILSRESPALQAGDRTLIPKNAFAWPILAGLFFARVGLIFASLFSYGFAGRFSQGREGRSLPEARASRARRRAASSVAVKRRSR